jgi:hypothetical protein
MQVRLPNVDADLAKLLVLNREVEERLRHVPWRSPRSRAGW